MMCLKKGLWVLLLTSSWGMAFADEPWLLLSHANGQDTVVTAGASAFHTVATVGRVISYGKSERNYAFLSYQALLATVVLNVVDRATRQSTSFTLGPDVAPVGWMSGANLNMVLTEQYAYFVTFLKNPDGSGVASNTAGGLFDLGQIALTDGKLKRFPLPKECINARIVELAGVPLVFAWDGYGVWKFDEAAKSVVTLVSKKDVADITARDENAQYSRNGRQTAIFANYVMVPGEGAFRLSRIGELQQVLNADLTLAKLPRHTLKVASVGEQPEILLANFHGAPAIGVVRMLGDHVGLKYIDPLSFDVIWEATLPQNTWIPSIYALSSDELIYLDRDARALKRTSPQGTERLWDVTDDVIANGVNVLSIQ